MVQSVLVISEKEKVHKTVQASRTNLQSGQPTFVWDGYDCGKQAHQAEGALKLLAYDRSCVQWSLTSSVPFDCQMKYNVKQW